MTRLRRLALGMGLVAGLAVIGFASGGRSADAPSADFAALPSWTVEDLRPTDVSLLDDGSAAAADPARDRVVGFGPSGDAIFLLTEAAGRTLSAPTGLGSDGQSWWVADTGNGRLVHVGPTGRVLATLDVARDEPGWRPLDVAVTADGLVTAHPRKERLMLLDSESGAVVERFDMDPGDGTQAAPLQVAVPPAGGADEAVAAMLLNGEARAAATALTGEYFSVGRWGVGEGGLMRPSGIAWLPRGGWLVADLAQGVVQLFGTDGSWLQMVASQGQMIEFDRPRGMDLRNGVLAVAEQDGGRIARFSVTRSGAPAPGFPPGRILVPRSAEEEGDLSPICRVCHDAALHDNARHFDPAFTSHPRKLEPGVELPSDVARGPDGDLACASCHSFLHGDSDRTDHGGLRLFGLDEPRVDSGRGGPVWPGGIAFCTHCHDEQLVGTRPGRARTNHPVGVKPPARAHTDELAARGAHLDAGGRLECQTCHRAHGASEEHLLVLSPDDATLCVQCHGKLEAQSAHPLREIGCLECHEVHGSSADHLLRRHRTGGTCAACHEEQRGVLQTSHRVLHSPDRDATVGPCGGCHGMHGAAPVPGVTDGRTSTACRSCHDRTWPGRPADWIRGSHDGRAMPARFGTLPASEAIGCSTCHETHGESGYSQMLRKPVADGAICVQCHEEKRSVLGTDHDPSVGFPGRPKRACLGCHDVHAPFHTPDEDMPAGMSEEAANGRCRACHSAPGRHEAIDPGPSGHTARVPASQVRHLPAGELDVVLFSTSGEAVAPTSSGGIACSTCHDPHHWTPGSTKGPGTPSEGSNVNSFLREVKPLVAYCSRCHGEEGLPRFSFFHRDTYRGDER